MVRDRSASHRRSASLTQSAGQLNAAWRQLRSSLWRIAPLLAGLSLATPAAATCQLIASGPQTPQTGGWVLPSGIRVASASPELALQLAQAASLAQDEVGLRYIGHSTFEITSPKGVRIATDYNDRERPSLPPRVATMNNAHSTHFTLNPNPAIEHVLTGWNPEGGPIHHDIRVEDVRIRNLPTNARGWDGETRAFGNSIFIFELADLCIAHLGHLHHQLTADDLATLGRIDVVLAPVDNAATLRLDSLMAVLDGIKPSVVVPMHFHFGGALERFLARAASEGWAVTPYPTSAAVLSRKMLPEQRTVVVMMPGGG
ncbi:MBL fold metallo-hydrolase [Pannonibacter phragmitetus]|uniref:MBL fold metallo-hydrolase n=1 Tax=Pannonibacter phragmitetus TaxID=121719 RepID=UPI003D2EDE85